MPPARHIVLAVMLLTIPLAGAAQEPRPGDGPARRWIPEVGIPVGAVDFEVEPLDGNVEWLREEVDPIQRARRRIRELMLERAGQRARELADAADRSAKPQDPAVEWGDWRFSIGNNGNWSPYPDRELDARIIRFPLRMKTDNRSGAEKALDQMRKTKGN